MTTIATAEAKSHFSEMVERASKGEEIIITKRGIPVVKIISVIEIDGVEKRKALIEKLRQFRKGKKTIRKEGESWNDIARQGLK